MKIKFTFSLILIVLATQLLSGTDKFLELEQSAPNKTTLTFSLSEFDLVDNMGHTKIQIPNISATKSEKGMPEIPLITTMFQVQTNKNYEVKAEIIDSSKIDNIYLVPFQGEKEDNSIFSKDYNFYSSDKTYPPNIVTTSNPKSMRGMQIISIEISPFSYKPKTKELTIYDEIKIVIEEKIKTEPAISDDKPASRVFTELLSEFTINQLQRETDEEFQNPAILYICSTGIVDNIYFQQLTNWRHKTGYTVYTESIENIGDTAEEIKNYIRESYENYSPAPEYVCLVGDTGGSYSIPTFYEEWGHNDYGNWCEGDQPFAQLDGNDILPEVIMGRISIRSITDLAVVASKIINYEKATHLNQNIEYYNSVALIADPSESGMSTIITNEYIQELMQNYGIDSIHTNYDNGNYANWMTNQLNDGVLFFNYRGFYGVSGFSNDNIDNANNGFKLPFASVLTCGTGSFAENEECLSEKFLRAGAPTNPKGAIAAVSTATSNTHTMFNNIINMGIYDGIFSKNLRTAGAVLANGKLSLYATYPHDPSNWVSAFSHWNNLMGDPATELWSGTPSVFSVDYISQIPFGTNFVEMTISDNQGNPVENARVTLLKDSDEIFENYYTNAQGKISQNVSFETTGTVFVTITKQNYQPYEADISIVNSNTNVNLYEEGDIVILDNDDGILNPGETANIQISLQNLGTEVAINVVGTISSESELLTITQASAEFGTMESGEIVSKADFEFTLSNSATEIDNATIQLSITDNVGNEWYSTFKPTIESCLLVVNSSGFIEQNQPTDLSISLLNSGSVLSPQSTAEILYSNELFSISNHILQWGEIPPNHYSESDSIFTITASSDVINGTIVSIPLSITDINGYNQILYYQIQIGETTEIDPLGPDQFGYYIYDSDDTNYELAPVYEWIEINPEYGGEGENLNMTDYGNGCASFWCSQYPESELFDLPFPFTFYGVEYEEITISTNGWISFGYSEMESFRNYPLPGPGGPPAMISAFWDDLKTTDDGNVFVYSDPNNEYLVIEWSDMRTHNYNSLEDFEIILYNNSNEITENNDIKIQYKTVNNTSSGGYELDPPIHGGYCTVGIENHLGNDGLQYTYNNSYPISSKILSDEMALFITTKAPDILSVGELHIAPEAFNVELEQNATTEIQLEISNDDFGSSFNYQTQIYYPSTFEEVGGGPDNFNYFWSDSNIENDIEFQWIDISENNSAVVFSHNDIATTPINIGFDFPFYAQNYSECIISPNGWIGFGEDWIDWHNYVLPISDAPKPAIFGFWDDLNPVNDDNATGVGSVCYHSNEERLVVWFNNVSHYTYEDAIYDFQIVLYSNGEIAFNYNQMQGNTTSATIGVQNENGDVGLPVIYNEGYIQDNMSVTFENTTPEIDWFTYYLTEDNYSGELDFGESAILEFVIDANELSVQNYSAGILVLKNNQPNTTIQVDLAVLEEGNVNIDYELQITNYELIQCYPNPFNPVTTIGFTIPTAETKPVVSLQIFNLQGKLVEELLNQQLEAGYHSVVWDATNFSSGVYFARLQANEFSQTQKLLLLK